MKVNGFPPGLMKNMDKLPESNPHKRAFIAQQENQQLQAEQLEVVGSLFGLLMVLFEGLMQGGENQDAAASVASNNVPTQEKQKAAATVPANDANDQVVKNEDEVTEEPTELALDETA